MSAASPFFTAGIAAGQTSSSVAIYWPANSSEINWIRRRDHRLPARNNNKRGFRDGKGLLEHSAAAA